MNTKPFKVVFRTVRAVVFSTILVVAGLYVLAYALLSAPPVQRQVCAVAQKELTALLGGQVRIEALSISPFTEVQLRGVTLLDPGGELVATARLIGAGIDIWAFVLDGRIRLTYAEVVGLDARLWQQSPGAPLNIDYIVKALQPKDKTKPPAKFELALEMAVIRQCALSFDKRWKPALTDTTRIDFNHLRLTGIRADMRFSRIADDGVEAELRRLAFDMPGGLSLTRLGCRAVVSPRSLSVEGLQMDFPHSHISLSDIKLDYDGYARMLPSLLDNPHTVTLEASPLAPSDFKSLLPAAEAFDTPFELYAALQGCRREVQLKSFSLENPREGLSIYTQANVVRPDSLAAMRAEVQQLEVKSPSTFIAKVLSALPGLRRPLPVDVERAGPLSLKASGHFDMGARSAEADVEARTCGGLLAAAGSWQGIGRQRQQIEGTLSLHNIDAAPLLRQPNLGPLTLEAQGQATLLPGDVQGTASVSVAEARWNGLHLGGLDARATKQGRDVQAELTVDNPWLRLEADGGCLLAGPGSEWRLNADLQYLDPVFAPLKGPLAGNTFSGRIFAKLNGNTPDNLTGRVLLADLCAHGPEKSLTVRRTLLEATCSPEGWREVGLDNDWINARLAGKFRYPDLSRQVMDMASAVLPGVFPHKGGAPAGDALADLHLTLLPAKEPADYFRLPLRPLDTVTLTAALRGGEGTMSLSLDAPYLQQGEKKLIQGTALKAFVNRPAATASLWATSTLPAKKGEMEITADVNIRDNYVMSDIDINADRPEAPFRGSLSLAAEPLRDPAAGTLGVDAVLLPSHLTLNDAVWNVAGSRILYGDKRVSVEDFKVWHDNQFVSIDGIASASPDDRIEIGLADIDVGFIFDTLNINYVSFGGTATGEITASGVFGPEPVALTKYLDVKDLSYNGAVLGDGALESHWDNAAKEVAINAIITGDGRMRGRVDGGIWVTRDSLSFDIDADRINVAFLRPFMEAFASDISGAATGHVKLAGTFSDIDLTGRVKADNVRLRLGYTNVDYFADDTITFDPGRIVLRDYPFRDRYGHSAILSGQLTHRYFHDPRFEFRVSRARDLLVYDTNRQMNPDWYGTMYGTGTAVVRGWPGMVTIGVDMATSRNSSFTFVLNDTEAAGDYGFLTFTDRRKAEQQAQADTVPEFLKAFRRTGTIETGPPTVVDMDLRMSVNPDALLTLVMDPVAGDRITARGTGSVNIPYNSESDEMSIYGKYTVEEGMYNFTLQDLILRDFKIRSGSTISFDGDPMDATLDITASYRVNTNLSDLDKSFSTDRDLNRTNVPVDAVLHVDGKMQSPQISFDIELPTLTADVTRKVKSIISTEDQMSRQIIYLLALNRFYTPEYMGHTGSTGSSELAAVASSTLSSQLSNMLGQLTDKVSLAPSIRSDKGDFSDLEVDLALSSRLLDNRLLVNGNFGYRDRATSTTTFVGDFDIEYLLSRNGGLRLKAYNHFNDQNYYLRSALTTQGLGMIYRHDFDRAFNFLRRRKNDAKKPDDDNTDDD